MCCNLAGGCFLVYSATFVIQKHVCSNQAEGCFLLTNYSNYVAFDETLVLLEWLKKAIAKIRKRLAFWKQPLDNIPFKYWLVKIRVFCSTVLAFGTGRSRTFAVFQNGALCYKSEKVETITTAKSSIFYVARSLYQPLKSIDRLI